MDEIQRKELLDALVAFAVRIAEKDGALPAELAALPAVTSLLLSTTNYAFSLDVDESSFPSNL